VSVTHTTQCETKRCYLLSTVSVKLSTVDGQNDLIIISQTANTTVAAETSRLDVAGRRRLRQQSERRKSPSVDTTEEHRSPMHTR